MSKLSSSILYAAAAALGSSAPSAAQAPASVPRPTSESAVPTYLPGHRLGQASAPVTLTEYVSYTCGHCQHFARDASPLIKWAYVIPGRVAVEVQHVVRDPLDFAMVVAVNCGPAAGFGARHDAMMAEAPNLLARVRALPSSTLEAWQATAIDKRSKRIADDTGITAWMRARGTTNAAIEACFADRAFQQRIVALSAASADAGVDSTPMFAINRRLLDGVHDWSALRPALEQALTRPPAGNRR